MSLLAITAFIAVLVDQLSKLLTENLLYKKSMLFFTYVQNRGAAWGILANNELLLKVLSFVLIVIIIAYFMRAGKCKFDFFTGGLVVGGAFGNYIDRLFRGYVVDFVDFKFWPVFNVADVCIVLGCLLFVANTIVNESKNSINKA